MEACHSEKHRTMNAVPLQFSFYLLNKWCFHALKIKVMYLWDSGDSHFALFLSWNNFRLVQTLLTTEFTTESTYSCSSGVLQNHRKSVKIKPWASQVLLTEDFVHTSPWFSTHILSGLLWRLSSRVVARNWLFFPFCILWIHPAGILQRDMEFCLVRKEVSMCTTGNSSAQKPVPCFIYQFNTLH